MKKQLYVYLLLSLLFMSGCLYPETEKAKNSGPVDIHIASVEDAIARYQQSNGVYPILNSTLTTPIYEKYRIDINRIYPGYLGYLPPNAFENGGPFLYVMVDLEKKPSVKLIDLNVSNKVETMQRLVNEYQIKKGSFPFGEPHSLHTYTIDYQKLKVARPDIISPFTEKTLPLILSEDGQVLVDYSLDIGIYLNQGYTYEGDDAREVLVQHSFFVPVKSVPYEYKNGDLKLLK